MSLERLAERGQTIAKDAARRRRDSLLERLRLDPDVRVEAVQGGIRLSARGLFHRYVTNSKLRNAMR